MKLSLSILLAATALFAVGCGGGGSTAPNANAPAPTTSANTNTSAAFKDDLDELAMVITVPFIPIDGKWREEDFSKGEMKGKKLTAVLRFSKEDAAKLAALAEKNRPPVPEVVNTETWFPEELVAQSQMSGDETLKGITYGANDFYSRDYLEGKLTRIESTSYFIVELYAKQTN